jgi:hypothetical protein
MEPENNNQPITEDHKSTLCKVTPLSKYLAMVLFIALPFMGGWIGYRYAPEKVVEVERVVFKEVIKEVEKAENLVLTPSNVFEYSSLKEGEKYGDMVAEKVLVANQDRIEAEFSGLTVLVGTLTVPTSNPEDKGMGPDYSISQLTDNSVTKLPIANTDDRTVWFGINAPDMVNEAGLKNGDLVEVTIDKYYYILLGAGVWNNARVVSIKKLNKNSLCRRRS